MGCCWSKHNPIVVHHLNWLACQFGLNQSMGHGIMKTQDLSWRSFQDQYSWKPVPNPASKTQEWPILSYSEVQPPLIINHFFTMINHLWSSSTNTNIYSPWWIIINRCISCPLSKGPSRSVHDIGPGGPPGARSRGAGAEDGRQADTWRVGSDFQGFDGDQLGGKIHGKHMEHMEWKMWFHHCPIMFLGKMILWWRGGKICGKHWN